MINFTTLIQLQFNKMCGTGKLFRSSLTGQQIWDLYISGFNKEQNPIFRDPNSSTHNCNLCKNFIRRYGNIVAVDENYDILTMFDVTECGDYTNVAKTLSDTIKRSAIANVFFETFDELNSLPYESCNKNATNFKLGIDKNVKRYTKEEAEKYGVVKPNEIRTFNHLHLYLPKQFVSMSNKSIESIMSDYRDAKNVFQRTMKEIPLDTLNLVKDLIQQGSLLDGQTHLYKIEQIIPFKQQYDNMDVYKRDNWCWMVSSNLPYAKFKNELIGVLCTELAEGKELNAACQAWNKRVDPVNYMKAVASITKKQIEEARKFVEENGYEESFNRRFATIDDIKASEILHINIGKGDIKNISIFDEVKPTSTKHKRSEFYGIEEVSIDKFMTDILPNCTSVEAFLSNKHEGNMVSLTTTNIKESKPIFKWSNNYSWTFNGNLAGKSQIKEAVKVAGGKVDGVLRFSIMWSGINLDNSDLDAHCIEPHHNEIYFGRKFSHETTGELDIDIMQPLSQMPNGAVENIVYPQLIKMVDGTYKFFVRQYNARNSQGFKAEIEFNGESYYYEYNQPVRGDIMVANVTLNDGQFSIEHLLPTTRLTKELYGLQTGEFHKVNLVCLSPNHWGNNNIGNKHYFFMLNDCICPTSIRSFHNENLIPELAQHRKVLEVLGNTTMIGSTNKQLSGLGFNATVRDELIVKLSGSFKRLIKIKF
ncbi:MAG: hypothetical protein M0R17_08535 [Candidatus Omnitrophica bacterium]|nr:hypothetical protein [Candidatus Omnitrophota bacterium]